MFEQLQEWIKQGESERIEFNLSFGQDTIETLAAFANARGGIVLIGVSDDKEIKGIDIADESVNKWINEIKSKTVPQLVPDVGVIDFQGKTVVYFGIAEYPVKPVACKGRYYKRVKNTNHQLSVTEIANLNLQSLQTSWDAYPAHGKTMEDIDLLKVERFVQKVNAGGRFRLDGTLMENLEKLKLINKGVVTNAAWLLFAKEDTHYNVHLGRFKTPSLIIDDKMYFGTLFEVVEDAIRYIISQIQVAFEITGMPTQRTEIFEYPLPALREIVLNAIVHRDYMSPVDIQIKIFDKKITFFNPGTLHGDLTVEDLKQNNYQAYARNKLIAEAFYLCGDIEKYGSGFIRIRKELKKYPTMKIDFENIPNGFLVSVSYEQRKMTSDESINMEKVGERVGEKVGEKVGDKVTNKVTEKVTDKVTEKVTEKVADVTDNQNMILSRMKTTPNISAEELSSIVGISVRKIKENLAKLKAKGLLERIGPDKGGYWKVNN